MKSWDTFAFKSWTRWPDSLYVETWADDPDIQIGDQINQLMESGRTAMFTVSVADRMRAGSDHVGGVPWSLAVEPIGYMEKVAV